MRSRLRRKPTPVKKGFAMVQVMIEMPEEALGALRKDPEEFARELRLDWPCFSPEQSQKGQANSLKHCHSIQDLFLQSAI